MKTTKIKISICQDGSLSEGSVSTIAFQFPVIPKKLLKPMGFEKVDDTTYVGLNPVFLTLLEKDQEIKIEFSVEASEARKKILNLFEKGFKEMELKVVSDGKEGAEPKPKTTKKAATEAKANSRVEKTGAKKTAAVKKAAAAKKTAVAKKTAAAKRTKSEPTTRKSRTTRNSTAKKAG